MGPISVGGSTIALSKTVKVNYNTHIENVTQTHIVLQRNSLGQSTRQ